VEAVARRLGDRVKHWITQNEPFVASWLGYGWGVHAPGRASTADALAAAHHLLLSHGRAVEAIRRASPGAEVGITLNLTPAHPMTDSEADVAAAAFVDGQSNRWFLDAVLRGEYPADMLERYAPFAPPVRAGDLEAISAPLDFLGVNNYTRCHVRAGPGGEPHEVRPERGRLTEMDWEVYPDGLHDILTRVEREYVPPPIYVTENGAAFADVPAHDGEVRDIERREFLAAYVAAAARAVADGVPLRGYFVWSLLDNFEWALGYSRRFGIVYVDYPTLARVPKLSFAWYRELVAAHRARRQAELTRR
jgi:beta-glucosidase